MENHVLIFDISQEEEANHLHPFTISPQSIQDRESLMRALDILGQQVQIFHCGVHLGVPEDDRKTDDIATVPQVLGREAMPQAMETRASKPKALQQTGVAPKCISLLPSATRASPILRPPQIIALAIVAGHPTSDATCRPDRHGDPIRLVDAQRLAARDAGPAIS